MRSCVAHIDFGIIRMLLWKQTDFKNPTLTVFGKCKGLFSPKEKWISLRLKQMQIYACTVEGAAQTHFSVLAFWIAEE